MSTVPTVWLTDQQIDVILEEVKQAGIIKGLIPEATKTATESMLQNFRQQLKMQPIKESKIGRIAGEIIKGMTTINHPDGTSTSMKISNNAPVGVTATEALCQPVTQMTMKSFHHAGSAVSVGHANQSIKEILNASKNRKNTWARLYFTENLNFREVYDKSGEIVSTTLKNICQVPEIGWYTPENVMWWHDYIWSDVQQTVFQPSQIFIRLRLNMETLYERGISITKVAKVIRKTGVRKLVVSSPEHVGTIDIIPDTELIYKKAWDLWNSEKKYGDIQRLFSENTPENKAELVTLYIQEYIITRLLKETLIQGIPHITNLSPVTIKVLGASVYDEILRTVILPDGTTEQRWLICLNVKAMKSHGITIKRIKKIFKKAGYTILSEQYNTIEINTLLVDQGTSPVVRINNISDPTESTELFRLCNLVVAETNGTNLRELFLRDDIDRTLTISNDFNELQSMFGVEATRIQMLREMGDLFNGSKSEINGRHLILLGDLMTNIGELTAINYNGVAKQQGGIFARVAYERGFATLSTSAGIGATDQYLTENLTNVTPTASGILTGQMFSTLTPEQVKKNPVDMLKKLKMMTGLKLSVVTEENLKPEQSSWSGRNVLQIEDGKVVYEKVKEGVSLVGVADRFLHVDTKNVEKNGNNDNSTKFDPKAFYNLLWDTKQMVFEDIL